MLAVEKFEGKRVLWIDDRVDIHRLLIAKMEKYGVHVSARESIEDGIADLAQAKYHSILLDAMLGHESAIPQLPRLASMAHMATINVCSGFMYRDRLQEEKRKAEEECGRSVGTIEKTWLPDTEDSESVYKFIRSLFGDDNKKKLPSEKNDSISIIALEYSRYSAMGLEEKMDWIAEVEPLIRSKAAKYFDDGYAYILFCGSEVEPVMACEYYSDIPTEKQVNELAKKRGFAPLPVHNVGAVDDVSTNCCDRSGLRGYPTLLITGADGSSEDVHFDNGASQSLMSYEWYGEKGWVPPLRNPELLIVGEMKLVGRRWTIDEFHVEDSVGSVREIEFTAYYVVRWSSTRLAIRCGPRCGNEWRDTNSREEICRFRTGLLGRTLPRDELKVRFATDFESGSIWFMGD